MRLPPPAGLFHLPTRFCYFAFILLPEHILQPFCHQTHLVRLPLLRRAFPTHFILHIFPIIFLPVTLSPNNFAAKCGSSALAPAPQGFPTQSHHTSQPFMQSRRSPAPHDHLSVAPPLHPRHGAAPTSGKFYFPIPPNIPHHLPSFSRRALPPPPPPAGATAAPSLSNF